MESMQYAESVVKEFLLFRGFTHTLHSFETELEADVGHGFQVDRIVDLIFTVYIPCFEANNLVKLVAFLQHSFSIWAESRFHATVRKLDASLKKYYIVNAIQKGRNDQVLHFFEQHGDALLRSGTADDWHSWFGTFKASYPLHENAAGDPRFQVYFSKEWLETLIASVRNFLSEAFDSLPVHLPALLKLHNERVHSRALKQELENLRTECTKLQVITHARESEILKLQSDYQSAKGKSVADVQDDNLKTVNHSHSPSLSLVGNGTQSSTVSPSKMEKSLVEADKNLVSETRSEETSVTPSSKIHSMVTIPRPQYVGIGCTEDPQSWSREEEIPHVVVETQETFSGHTSPITRCRFSTAGSNVASASVDGTVRIWTPDRAASTSRNATIYCGAEILALEWESKSDRLLLLGTAGGGVKAWNVEAKRVVCDLNTDAAFPRILELRCSPTDALFVSAAATQPNSAQGTDAVGFGSLTVWNMRTWKLMNVLPLGQDPPVVTSVCFNHNGKLVAVGATDGMIRLFDMNGCLPITGWPAHDGCAVSSVRFGHDHSSIFSLGSDGNVLEWSLHNQGQILQSQDASMFCSIDGSKLPRHEMALDAQGRNLLLSSNLHFAPLFTFHDPVRTYRTLNHNGAVTSVDWHPLLPMFLTGSSDHSVRLTSIA